MTGKEYSTTWEVSTNTGWVSARRSHLTKAMAEEHKRQLEASDMAKLARNVGPVQVRTITVTVGEWVNA